MQHCSNYGACALIAHDIPPRMTWSNRGGLELTRFALGGGTS